MNIKSYHVTLLEEKTLFTTDVFLVSAATERLLNPDFGPFFKGPTFECRISFMGDKCKGRSRIIFLGK